MSRDYRKLRVFALADDLVVAVYAGSASEARYLLDLSRRLGFIPDLAHDNLVQRDTELLARLQSLIHALSREPYAMSRKP